tara:strand:- start:485 stop:955 length:471 start_codon:yes stop_codon:yes gene_type:complete
MNNISKHDALMFFLVAIITISMASFTGNIQEYVRVGGVGDSTLSTPTSPAAAIFSQLENTQQEDSSAAAPLVTLIATPAKALAGDSVSVSWDVIGNAVTCTGRSNPTDAAWNGTKQASTGTHVQLLLGTGVDTTYSIECVGLGGRTSASSMTVLGG